MLQGKRILVAPLDWGLGHSTRCIPIIQRLIDRGATPIIGADNGPLALLQQEFPDLEHVRIPGITIRYAKGESQLWSMARQFPEMMRSVRAETALFDHIRKDLRLDAVISDQRFGLRSSTVPSVVITHQVFPFTPIAQGALRKLNVRHLSRFDRCWIMDDPGGTRTCGGTFAWRFTATEYTLHRYGEPHGAARISRETCYSVSDRCRDQWSRAASDHFG